MTCLDAAPPMPYSLYTSYKKSFMSSTRPPCAWPSSIWKKHSIVYPDVSCRLFASLALRSGWCVIHWDWPWEDTPHPMTQMAWPCRSQWWLVGWRKSRHDTQPQSHGRPRITCSKLTRLDGLALGPPPIGKPGLVHSEVSSDQTHHCTRDDDMPLYISILYHLYIYMKYIYMKPYYHHNFDSDIYRMFSTYRCSYELHISVINSFIWNHLSLFLQWYIKLRMPLKRFRSVMGVTPAAAMKRFYIR